MILAIIASKCSMWLARSCGSGEGSGEGLLKQPRGLAVSGSEMYVCDANNHRVQVFGLDGAFVRQWDTKRSGDGQLDDPHGVVVNGDVVLVTNVFKPRQWGRRGDRDGLGALQ